jgi:DNA primase
VVSAWVDIESIKREVTLKMILDHYGLMGTRQGSEVRLLCLFHDDTHPSLWANLEKGIWHCFGCGLKGDTVAFVIQHEGIDTGDRKTDRLAAARFLAVTFGIDSRVPPHAEMAWSTRPPHKARSLPPAVTRDAQRPVKEAEEARSPTEEGAMTPHHGNPPLTFTLRQLNTRHPYLLQERGLRPETIDHFGLGVYHGRGAMTGRAVIPIHNDQGELVAYAGRWPGEPPPGEPKYRLPLHFRKSLLLFNLHRACEHAAEGLIVVEGFFTVFDLWQKGRHNVVAVMGCALSAQQKNLLVETVGQRGRVLLAFDADPPGRQGMHEAAQSLVSQVFVRAVELR